MPSNAELAEIALTVARRGAAFAHQRRLAGVEVAATKSSLADIVTRADRETETLIRDALAAARPNDGFYGEESGGAEGSSGLTWVVDPIDGTVNYFYGIPAWAVSIAVVEGGTDTVDLAHAGRRGRESGGGRGVLRVCGRRRPPERRTPARVDGCGPRAGPRGHRVRLRRPHP